MMVGLLSIVLIVLVVLLPNRSLASNNLRDAYDNSNKADRSSKTTSIATTAYNNNAYNNKGGNGNGNSNRGSNSKTTTTTNSNDNKSTKPSSSSSSSSSSSDDEGNLPLIFVLGVQKGGSSSLFEFLIQHPLLCHGVMKEPHFFDHEPYNKKTRQDYMKLFPTNTTSYNIHRTCSSKARFIDGTTVMYKLDVASDRMAQFYTNEEKEKLKFIVLIREPVARDYSWYGQVIRDKLGNGIKFNLIETFAEADAKRNSKERDSHIHRSGRYVEQLEHFIRNFKRDQILIISSDAVFKNSSAVMDSVSGFLGVKKIDAWNGPFPHDDHLGRAEWRNMVDCIVSHIPKLDCKLRDELAEYYQPWNTELELWMEKTKPDASKWEPTFIPFGDSWKNIKCVDDARKEFDAIIYKKPSQLSCLM